MSVSSPVPPPPGTPVAPKKTSPLVWVGIGCAVIIVICLTVNFIGDGLRDALDPTQTRVRA